LQRQASLSAYDMYTELIRWHMAEALIKQNYAVIPGDWQRREFFKRQNKSGVTWVVSPVFPPWCSISKSDECGSALN
jgi:hypothetical protein